jgi:hypothetical protein
MKKWKWKFKMDFRFRFPAMSTRGNAYQPPHTTINNNHKSDDVKALWEESKGRATLPHMDELASPMTFKVLHFRGRPL